MRGYAGKLLEVNLSTEKIAEVTLDEQVLRQFIGGRGLATKILWDRLGAKWENIDPLGPENVFLALTGPLTGFFPGAKLCISGKSPQSNGVVGSTLSCEFAVELKCAGYDGIIITGKAKKPSYIFITDSKAEIKDASHIWGKSGKEALRTLTKEGLEELKRRVPRYGGKEPAAIYIGPAGENKVRMATVMAKWTHAAGYGGYGAVMGSKNLKAIVARGTGPLPDVVDIEKVSNLIDEICKSKFKNTTFRWWGTGGDVYDIAAKFSREPVRNWQEEWHDGKSIGVDKLEERVLVKRFWGCFGCPTTCERISMVKVGPFKGAITDAPDYEMQAYLGPNLGIFDIESITYLVALMDELGLCGIQTGNVLGFAAELYQRGILTKEDLDGIDLRWGDTLAFASLAKKIAMRDGVGEILAEGTYRAALKIKEMKGIDVLRYAVVEKGIGIGAHGNRSGTWTTDISYACSVQGGDHTSIATMPPNNGELKRILEDSGVFCAYNTPENFNLIWDFFEAVTGWKIDPDEWYANIARRILHLQRVLLLIGGPDLKWSPAEADENPPRFYEPLPSGPYAGKKLDREKFKISKKKYYDSVGWDENGVPKLEELKRLGLSDVIKKLNQAQHAVF